jgi:hypothetical protein
MQESMVSQVLLLWINGNSTKMQNAALVSAALLIGLKEPI